MAEAMLLRFDEGVAEVILDVIKEANKELIIVSPYLKLWDEAKGALQSARKRKVDITFVLRLEGKLFRTPDFDWLEENDLDWVAIEDLHAKIYLNEETVVLSSMNLYEYSAQRNLEFAYILTDEVSKTRVREYIKELVPSGAFCIRCGQNIEPNPNKPLCYPDYKTWARYKRRDYPEKFCFRCGESAKTTMADPYCDNCVQILSEHVTP